MKAHSPRQRPVAQFSALAVASLILGILALPTLLIAVGFVLALIGVFCGHIALTRIAHSKGRLRGRPAALLGLLCGYFTIVLTPPLAAGLYFGLPAVTEKVDALRIQKKCDAAAKLYLACEAYARDHGDAYPREWTDLEGKYLNMIELRHLQRGAAIPWITPSSEFQLRTHERPVLPARSGQVVVIEEVAPASLSQVIVVRADGNTDIVLNPNHGQGPE